MLRYIAYSVVRLFVLTSIFVIQVLARKEFSRQQKSVNTQEVKLIGGLLTGVNRAFPYAKGDISSLLCF